MYDLASYPKYISPLREEIEAVIMLEGWEKSAISKMHKLDSFLKESSRLHPLGAGISLSFSPLKQVGAPRKALETFTFSDGTTVPKGTLLGVPLTAIHYDKKIYPNAHEFDGLRFYNLTKLNRDNTKYQWADINLDYLVFGAGVRQWYLSLSFIH